MAYINAQIDPYIQAVIDSGTALVTACANLDTQGTLNPNDTLKIACRSLRGIADGVAFDPNNFVQALLDQYNVTQIKSKLSAAEQATAARYYRSH